MRVVWMLALCAGCNEYGLWNGTHRVQPPPWHGPAGADTGEEIPLDSADTADTAVEDTAPPPAEETTEDTAPPPPPPAEETTEDTAPPPPPPPPEEPSDPCFEPENGYDTNPAARLVVTDSSAPVTVTYLGFSSAYTDELWLDAPYAWKLAESGATSFGSVVGSSTFPVGTELVFGIQVHNTGDHFQSGPGGRNADGVVHVAVTYEGNCSWVIGFEDLWGGGDLDFNDTELRIQGPLRQD